MPNKKGKPTYTIATRRKVWERAEELTGHPSDIWRKDSNGKSMNWQQYDDPKQKDGWKIVHITPPEEGGTDDIENLQARAIN